MAIGSPGCDRHCLHHIRSWHLLPLSIALPSSTQSDTSPQKPEEEDQEQGQGEEQNSGRSATILWLQHAEVQDGPNPSLFHMPLLTRPECSTHLCGKLYSFVLKLSLSKQPKNNINITNDYTTCLSTKYGVCCSTTNICKCLMHMWMIVVKLPCHPLYKG